MRIMTFNCNGIRSAARRGFFEWLAHQDADIICLQELKAQPEQVEAAAFHPPEYDGYFHCAEKKGYSGVGLYTRLEPDRIIEGLGDPDFDAEGRFIQADFGKLSVASLYLPSGTAGDHRQAVKYRFMDLFMDHLRALRRKRREYVICGDWNIAHTTKDIKNWRSNQNNSGFLPEERAWMDELFGPRGFVDAFRLVTDEPDHYTWWSFRGRAWEKNVGWRIDYQVITPGLRERVHDAWVYDAERFSDHAPLIVDYDLEVASSE